MAYWKLIFNADGRCVGQRVSLNARQIAEIKTQGLAVREQGAEPLAHTNYVLDGDGFREMAQDEIDAEIAAAAEPDAL